MRRKLMLLCVGCDEVGDARLKEKERRVTKKVCLACTLVVAFEYSDSGFFQSIKTCDKMKLKLRTLDDDHELLMAMDNFGLLPMKKKRHHSREKDNLTYCVFGRFIPLRTLFFLSCTVQRTKFCRCLLEYDTVQQQPCISVGHFKTGPRRSNAEWLRLLAEGGRTKFGRSGHPPDAPSLHSTIATIVDPFKKRRNYHPRMDSRSALSREYTEFYLAV